MSVGDLSRKLLFNGPRGDDCLRVVFVNKSLTTSGWTGGLRPSGEIASWIYRKGRCHVCRGTRAAAADDFGNHPQKLLS